MAPDVAGTGSVCGEEGAPAMIRADVTVVIPHYYAARVPNLPVIVDTLALQTLPPKRVLIWNNDDAGDWDLARFIDRAEVGVINAPDNYGPQARFLAGLLADTEWVLFHDNDVRLEPDGLRNLLAHAERLHHRDVATLDGRQRRGAHYRDWWKIHGHGLPAQGLERLSVDLSLGRVELVRRETLATVWFEIGKRPLASYTGHDDMAFSVAVQRHFGLCYVVAADASQRMVDLPRFGTGLCTATDWNTQRDTWARQYWPVSLATDDPTLLPPRGEV